MRGIDDPEAWAVDAAVHPADARRRTDWIPGRGRGREHARARDYLLKQGVEALPCVGDGRQSGNLRDAHPS